MNVSTLPQQTRTGSANCLDIGTRVAEFEITDIVGEGGFGTVYLALDHSLQRTVALKEYMPPALASRGRDKNVVVRSKRHQETFDAGLKSFINEARLLAQFDHPALIKVHRFWEENNTAYMAMRFYEGRTLKDIISDEPAMMTETWWKSVLKPILEALDVLYDVQILHRDISPENIMIQPGGEPVLLDFGAARQLIQNMTQALTVILKPGYAPIEQYADDPSLKQGPWTDIYALCAVVYSTIAKKAPPASVARLIKDPMQPLSQDDYPGYSRQFLFAISKGLAVKPVDRPQTIAEFSRLLGLDKLERRSSGTSSASALPAANNKRSSGKSKPLAAATKAIKLFVQRKWIIGVAGMACIAAFGLYSFEAGKNATSARASAIPKAAAAPAEKESARPAASHAGSSSRVPSSPQMDLPLPGQTALSAQKTDSRPADSTAKETGTVQLRIKPWGNILVDGVSMGVSPPLKKLDLPEGKHQIRLVHPNFRDRVVEVEISNRKAARIEHDFSRSMK